MTKALGASMSDDAIAEAGAVAQSLNAYQLYSLPNRADIKNNQTKQISLFEKFDVKYQKQGRLNSGLYFNGGNNSAFEKIHPDIYYVINNTKDANLDLPLPMGTIRFYENDANENMQFVGENIIQNTAKGEKIELKLGQMFNVFANGKIIDVNEVSTFKTQSVGNGCYYADIVRDYTAEIEFVNADDSKQELIYTQNMDKNCQVIKENIEGKLENISLYEWNIVLEANSNMDLKYVVRVKSKERVCN